MSGRGRSLAFLVGAALAAAAAAALAEGYGSSVARGYGALQPVVVAATELKRGRAIDVALVQERLEVRRVPARFLPPGTLADPGEALGLAPVGAVPAGSYLLASQLRPPRVRRPGTVLNNGRRPVVIAVSGAGALFGGAVDPAGTRVDVVVTTEPSAGAAGRAYVAAAGVPLLALGPGAAGAEVGGSVEATLGLTRAQALRLIAAQSFARQVTILPGGGAR